MEIWKDVVGFEGSYEVSDLGRVRNLRSLKLLKPRCADRYPHVAFYSNRPVERTVHSLVLEAFKGPRPSGMEALHWDDNKSNNALSNLRWGTVYENQADMARNNVRRRGPWLPVGHADRVKDLVRCGVSFTQIGVYLNINRNIIPRILENCHRYR
jgi:hypothetical protein